MSGENNYTPSLEELISFADEAIENPEMAGAQDLTQKEFNNQTHQETQNNGDEPDDSNEPEENLGDDVQAGTEESSKEVELTDSEIPEKDPAEKVDKEKENKEDKNYEFSDQLKKQYEFLETQGIIQGLPKDFEFDGTPEKFEEALSVSKSNLQIQAAREIWSSLPHDFQVAFEYALSGGTDIKQVQKFVGGSLNYDEFDLENREDQKYLLEQHLKKTTKLSDTKIARQIKYWQDTDTLEEEAELAINELKNLQEQEKQELLQQQAKQKELQEKQLVDNYTTFKNTVSELKDFPDKRKDEIVRSIWHPQKINGQEQTYFNYIDKQVKSNPEHLAQLASFYLDYDPQKGFNMSKKSVTKTKSKIMKSFRDDLQQLLSGTNTVHKSSSTSQPGVESFDMEKFLQYGK
jgi:hypothetical protein